MSPLSIASTPRFASDEGAAGRGRCGLRVVACLAVAASLVALAISLACPGPDRSRGDAPRFMASVPR